MPDDDASSPAAELPEPLQDALIDAHFGLQGEARAAAVQQLCAAHPQHAAALQTALQRLRHTDTLLDSVASEAVPPAARTATPLPAAFGPFTLRRRLGRGGFGEVWLAEQQAPIRRLVALKLLSPDVLDAAALARFERERQALGLLQHENVARVFDAGTGPDGRAFFVMEYVDGLPLTEHCDRHQLSLRQRLQLFLRVCDGVHHAHQKGVLHRDLKPSNILVHEQDGRAVPKIIDFGVAKALHGELGDRPGLTEHGRLLGTPEYMSPEQAAGAAVDTRADVYSLGALLFELLTGSLPFDSRELRQGGMLAAARLLAERPVPRPSQRLPAEARPELRAALGNDLDWVVLRALAKDPDERYPSVTTLAAELRRFQDDQPLQAAPPSRRYLLKKFMRRHRTGVLATGAALLGLLLALGGLVFGFLAVDDARALAVRERERAEDLAYAAQIASARLYLRSGDAVGGKLQLQRTPPQRRGFEYRYLAARCGEAQASYLLFRTLDLLALPDGHRVVGCGIDGTVRVIDLDGGKELRQLRGEGGERRSLSLHPDGRRLAAVAPNGSLELFDVDSGAVQLDLDLCQPGSQEKAWLLDVAFTPDGQRLACTDNAGTLYLLSIDGELLRTVDTGQRWVRAVDFDRTGASCLTAGEDGAVCLWDARDWTLRQRWLAPTAVTVFDAAFAPDGLTLATCSADGMVRSWNAAEPARLPVWTHSTDAKLLRLRFAPDGRTLAVSGGYRDSYLEVIDAATGDGYGPLLGPAEGVESLAFLPDSERLVSGGYDQTLRLWNVDRDRWCRHLVHDVAIEDIAVSADSADLAVVSQGGRVSVFAADNLTRRWTALSGRQAFAVAFDGARDRVLVLHPDGLTQWRADDGRPAGPGRDLPGHELVDMTVTADGEALLLVTQAGSLLRLRLADLLVQRTVALPGPGFAVAAAKDLVAATTRDGQLLCLTSGELRERWRTELGREESRYDVAIAPDGSRLAVALCGGHVAVLDATLGRELLRFDGHRDTANVAFSPDGSRLVTAGPDRSVKICDPDRGLELLTLRDSPHPAGRPTFSPDGKSLYCTASVLNGDNFVMQWHAPEMVQFR